MPVCQLFCFVCCFVFIVQIYIIELNQSTYKSSMHRIKLICKVDLWCILPKKKNFTHCCSLKWNRKKSDHAHSCILIAYISVGVFIFFSGKVSMISLLLLFYFPKDRQQSKPKSHFTCINTQWIIYKSQLFGIIYARSVTQGIHKALRMVNP